VNLDLEAFLQACGATFSRLPKSDKVKILARWTKEFPELVVSARRGENSPDVARDKAADLRYAELHDQEFYILPDDRSGMPTYECSAKVLPDLQELVSDTVTQCDELVMVSSDFQWSAVFVNHGSPQLVGRHFQERRTAK
jgi:hypothetical protein